MPEITKGWLVDAGAGTDDIDASETGNGGIEHGLKGGPVCDVCFLEDGVLGVGGDEGLGFGAEGEVCEDDVGAVGEEEAGE